MQIFYEIEHFSDPKKPVILTIGNFDGVHKGHLFLLQTMLKKAGTSHHTCAITFNNHPSETLRPENPTPLLCTIPHKIKLMEETGLNSLILLNFNPKLASLTAEAFIQKIRSSIPFSHLFLGHDATIGKGRGGNQETMQTLAHKFGFEVHYVTEYKQAEHALSSTQIRKLLRHGEIKPVEELLGRPYSIYSTVVQGIGKGKQIGFATANIDVSGLCLPPYGVYAVSMKRKDGLLLQGIANLGVAPTIKEAGQPTLEVHLFNAHLDLYGENVEVIFHQFIRPEKKFASIEDLKQQIQADIKMAQYR